MEEIAAMTQIINIMFQGMSMALKIGKETLDIGERCLKLFGNMAAAPVKGAKKAYTWAKYHKETGSTNIKNLYTRAEGDLTYLKLDAEMFQQMKKTLKKAGVLYTAVPPFKGAGKNSVHLMVASADMPRIGAILEEFKKYYIEEQRKHGMSQAEAEKMFKEKNSVETADEMMQEIGAMGDFDDFINQIETIFGKDYTADMVRDESIYYADEKLGFSKVPGWVPASEIEGKLSELAKSIKEQQNLEGVKTVGISFEHNPNDPEHSHIVGQTEDYIKVQLNERGKACVMLPKEYVHGDLTKESQDGKFTANIPEDMELLVVDIDEKSAAVSMSAKEFMDKYKGWEKQNVESMAQKRNAARKNIERFSDTGRYKKITIDKGLLYKGGGTLFDDSMVNNKALYTRVPNTGRKWCLKLEKGDYSVINDGNTYLTKLDMEKDYQIYDKVQGSYRTVSGKELYEKYDPVRLSKKQSSQAAQQKFDMGGKKSR